MSETTQETQETQRIEAPPRWQTDPARVERIAVLCGPVLLLLGHTSATDASSEVRNISGLQLAGIIETAIQADCGALWLLPAVGSEPRRTLDANCLVDFDFAVRELLMTVRVVPDYPLKVGEISSKTGLVGVRAQRKRGGIPMGVYAAWRDSWNVASVLRDLPSEPMLRARTFAEGVRLAAFALDQQLRFSPSYTGLQLLRTTVGHKPYDVPPLSEWVRDLVIQHAPPSVQWHRPVTPREVFMHTTDGALTIHKYDRNFSYVASAGEVPVGDPVHTLEFMPRYPGLYHVTARPPDGWSRDLPGPFHLGAGAGDYPSDVEWLEAWAWEPQLRLAEVMGWTFYVDTGWYWPEKHDLFRIWRERIWQARTLAGATEGVVGRIAARISKRAGVASIGRLNQKKARAIVTNEEARGRGLQVLHRELDTQGDWTGFSAVLDDFGKLDLIRPDWWGHIIANANERVFSALYQHAASVPAEAYVDAVYTLAPWPPADVRPEQLGKWKLERTVRVSGEQMDALNGVSAAAWVKRLAAIVRQQGGEELDVDDGEVEE